MLVCERNRREKFPFDVQHRNITLYDSRSPSDFEALKTKIIARLKAISAQDISSEQIQQLWERTLSGRIKPPGTFSNRTLDIVRNISQQEAELFVRVAQYAFFTRSGVFIPSDIGKFSGNKLVYQNLAGLAEVGLLQQSTAAIYPFKDGRTNIVFAFAHNVAVLVVKDPNIRFRVEPGLNVWILTNAARQLQQFFSWENPLGYADLFCEEVKKLGWIPTIGTYTNPDALEFHEMPQKQDAQD